MADLWRTSIDDSVAEGTTCQITGTLVDETGTAIPGASLTTLRFTLYNKTGLTILNSRNAVDILNANGGTVDSAGLVTMILDPADNQIVGAGVGGGEQHVGLFEWTWASGVKKGRHEVPFHIVNLAVVTS
jgi:hypothetical protein